MVANQILELTALGEIVVAGSEFANDMRQLAEIVAAAELLAWDLRSLNAQITTLFHIRTAPRKRDELSRRMAELRVVVFETRSYAIRTTTLLMTVDRTIRHLTLLLSKVKSFAGNMQANRAPQAQYDME